LRLLSGWETSHKTVTLEPASIQTLNTNRALSPLSKEQLIREAALLIFCDPLPRQCSRLQNLSKREWQKLLRWLDISGLALYFQDRMMELQQSGMIPSGILAHLQQNLRDNTERTRGMIAESIAIQQEFQEAGLSYAALKGFSLWPYSVPKLELRSQFDLDFLIAEKSLPEARQILERKGYRLFDVSGRSWEFKTTAEPGAFLKDLYKDSPFRSVELHVEANIPGRPAQLERIDKRAFHGISMPVLSPVDLFLGHGLHVYHHLLGEFSRASYLLEFRRHVLFRHDDQAFWGELQSMARENPRASLGLGVVTLLITRAIGDFAPEALTNWTVNHLPMPARLWVEMYGCPSVLESLPGSKLYLLLQKELASFGGPAKRSLRRVFLPTRVPPAFKWVAADETLLMRVRRHRRQLHFILFRLRFHIVEGLRYAWESYRWRQHMERLAR
jgi:hypothetical protein